MTVRLAANRWRTWSYLSRLAAFLSPEGYGTSHQSIYPYDVPISTAIRCVHKSVAGGIYFEAKDYVVTNVSSSLITKNGSPCFLCAERWAVVTACDSE